MDFSTVCRTCLSDQNLNQIFNDLNRYENYSRVIYLTTGVKVSPKDGLPQNMCGKCIHQLNSCFKFRKQCIKVESQLINMQLNTQQEIKYESGHNKHKNEFNFDKTDIKIENVELFKTESDLEFELDKNELFISKSPSQASSVSDSDEQPLKYLVENHSEEVTLMEGGRDPDESRSRYTTDSQTKRVACQYCQKLLLVRSIKTHTTRCHPRADDSKYCETEFEDKDVVVEHVKACTAKKRRKPSESYCKTEFEDKDVLVEHVKTCTAKKRRKPSESSREMRECDICHKKMQRASLKMHKAVKHAGLGPVCEHCGHSFGNKLRLTEHYRAKHGYDKLRCSYCDFHTASVMSLKNHERRHKGEKPFECETCGAKFHAAYLLSQHRQSHRTQKLVKCDMCPASFKANNGLHMHKMTCHSTDLYKCTICSRAYSCRLYALKHIRHVHQFTDPVPALQRIENAD